MLFLKISLDQSQNCGSGESELFVKNLVRSRCAEVVKTEHFALGSYDAAECGGESCCKTEHLAVGRNDAVAVFL